MRQAPAAHASRDRSILVRTSWKPKWPWRQAHPNFIRISKELEQAGGTAACCRHQPAGAARCGVEIGFAAITKLRTLCEARFRVAARVRSLLRQAFPGALGVLTESLTFFGLYYFARLTGLLLGLFPFLAAFLRRSSSRCCLLCPPFRPGFGFGMGLLLRLITLKGKKSQTLTFCF